MGNPQRVGEKQEDGVEEAWNIKKVKIFITYNIRGEFFSNLTIIIDNQALL